MRDCAFQNCSLSLTEDLGSIARVRNVSLSNTSCHNVHFGPFEASKVIIDGFRTSDLLILWSPFLDRVELKGEIGKLKINSTASPALFEKPGQRIFDAHREEFYREVEWALDISKARLKGFDSKGVPGHLFRRDPETQVLVTRERVLQRMTEGWEKELSVDNKDWPFALKMFVGSGEDSTVFAAPMGAPKKRRDKELADLNELRKMEFFEPD